MIPPLTEEEFERLVPAWAKELVDLDIPHIVGLPVYDVLYGTKYSENRVRGVVQTVSEYPDGYRGCTVLSPNRSWSSCSQRYWVADTTTPEGAAHVAAWKKANP